MTEKIKVLLDTSPLSNLNRVRGVGAYTRNLSKELDSIPEILLERSTHKTSQDFKPDLVHYPFFDLFFPTLPLVKKAPTIVTIHDLIPLIFPDHYPVGVRGKLNWKRQQLALKSVHTVITDSQASKNDIIRFLGFPKDRVEVVYLAGNPEIQAATKVQIRTTARKYGLPKEYLLYVGDINYNKNLVQLIKAIKYLPERVHLVLLGKNFREQNIPEWQWIETQISLSDVSDRTHFVTDLNIADTLDLSAIYSGAVAYVQPSLYEGFGLPVLEAMQAGCPVVCAENSSLIEVGGEQAVFVGIGAEEIAAGVRKVLAWSEDERQAVIEQSINWAMNFSWQRTALETAKIYGRVIDAK